MTLDSLLNEYLVICQQEASLKEAKEQLRTQILDQFEQKQLTEYVAADGSVQGKVVQKTTVRYTDEAGVMDFLKMRGMQQYFKTVLDTTALNKRLKTSQTLQESLKGKYTQTASPSLTVKSLV